MKILVLATALTPNPGGIQRYSHALAVASAKVVGAENVLVLPFNGDYVPTTEYKLNDRLARSKRLFGVVPRRWVLAVRARKLINEFRPDLVICNHVELAPYGLWARKKFGSPYWVAAYGIEVWGTIPPEQHDALKKCDKLLVISTVTQEILLNKGFDGKKMELLHYGFDTALFSPGSEKQNAAPVILTVCRLDASERYKGYDRVIELMPKLLKEFPGLIYRIVGDGSDRPRIEELAASLGVKSHLDITGFLRDPVKVVEQYRSSNLFVMPSEFQKGDNPRGEGFGFVYLEAAACGKPAIAAKGGGANEAIVDGETGILVDTAGADNLYQALAGLLRSPEKARAMGEAGRARVIKSFSQNIFQKRFAGLLGKR